MAFGVPYQPGFAPGYYPMGQPTAMPDQLAQLRQAAYPQQQQTAQQTAPIIWVQGEEAAKSYLCAPGNSVLLMDSEKSSFYIKTVDASGMPQPLRIFDYAERTAAQKQPTQTVQAQAGEFVTRAVLDALTAQRIEAKDAKIAEQNQQIFAAQLAASQAAQNETLKAYMSGQLAYYNPRPVPAFPVPAPYQYGNCGTCNGCAC